MRNAYTYINFGDFVDGSSSSTADPYVQLLSTTNDTAEAHADFVRVRGNSPWTPSGATLGERLHARLPLIIGLSAAAGVVLLLAFGACCYFSRRDKRRRVAFFRTCMSAFQAGGHCLALAGTQTQKRRCCLERRHGPGLGAKADANT